MKKAIFIFLVNLISVLTIWGQTEIIFPEKSLSLNQSIKNKMKNAYFNLPVGGELILSVLSGKEIKKLNAKDKVEFSKIPSGKDSKLLIYEIVNKTNMKWAIIKVTTGEFGYIENIELKESSISEFKSKTKGIW
mgnify:FL=1|jgi:hypothetical protein|tara:strand:+ start:169 stop:570 length:402 start_codon:yes stop_codon:yes gene_type:complete